MATAGCIGCRVSARKRRKDERKIKKHGQGGQAKKKKRGLRASGYQEVMPDRRTREQKVSKRALSGSADTAGQKKEARVTRFRSSGGYA
jgi:hypothetical protein